MSFELKLAWRYFRARRRTSLARFTGVVAVVGIAAGVASLIVAQALARGFADEMRDKILANTAHVSVFSADGAKLENWREIKSRIEKTENVGGVSETSYESSFLIGAEAVSYAFLRTDAVFRSQIPNPSKTAIAVGEKLADKTGVKLGDEVEIVVLENQTDPRRVRVLVAGIFQTGLYEYDSTWIQTSPENFARLYGERNYTPTNLNVSVRDIYKARETAEEIRKTLGENFKVLDWQEANQPLFAALSLERKVTLAIISLIIFIAALNVTTTLALLVNERRLDIAVLRTCGARTKNLVAIFLLEGFFLSILGIAFGLILGLTACFVGNYFRLISLSAEVYSLNYIPLKANFSNVCATVSITIILCLTATIYPAWKASRISPLENLRAQ